MLDTMWAHFPNRSLHLPAIYTGHLFQRASSLKCRRPDRRGFYYRLVRVDLASVYVFYFEEDDEPLLIPVLWTSF